MRSTHRKFVRTRPSKKAEYMPATDLPRHGSDTLDAWRGPYLPLTDARLNNVLDTSLSRRPRSASDYHATYLP